MRLFIWDLCECLLHCAYIPRSLVDFEIEITVIHILTTREMCQPVPIFLTTFSNDTSSPYADTEDWILLETTSFLCRMGSIEEVNYCLMNPFCTRAYYKI